MYAHAAESQGECDACVRAMREVHFGGVWELQPLFCVLFRQLLSSHGSDRSKDGCVVTSEGKSFPKYPAKPLRLSYRESAFTCDSRLRVIQRMRKCCVLRTSAVNIR